MYKKIIFCICGLLALTTAQANDNQLFRKYDDTEKEILNALKLSGGISTFNSMKNLKKQAETVASGTVVNADLIKASTKNMTGEEIVKKRSESALLICKYMPKVALDESVQVGASAIALTEDGVCISNYHVFVSLIDSTMKLSDFDSIFFVATKSGKLYPITAVLSYNKAADIAVFKVDTKGEKMAAIPMGYDLPEGANIHALTHPVGHFFYYSKGVVARNMCTDENDPFSNRAEITADFAKGSSGGPLMDDCGNLAAMVTTTQSIYYVDRPQTSLQMVVKTVIPASSIKRLVRFRK